MKELLVRICAVALLAAPLHLAADTETVNGVEWSYETYNGEARLIGGYGYTEELPLFVWSHYVASSITELVGYNKGAVPDSVSGSVTVPSSLGGSPVTLIGEGAFVNCSNITEIVIPPCVAHIDPEAFTYCPALERITVSQGNANYKSEGGALYSADSTRLLAVPRAAETIVISESVEYVRNRAFTGCGNIKCIEMPSGFQDFIDLGIRYGEWSYDWNMDYEERTYEWVNEDWSENHTTGLYQGSAFPAPPFLWCDALEEIKVQSGCEKYSTLGGALFDKNQTTLYRVPCALGSFEIQSSVKYIGSFAFAGNVALKTIAMPATVSEIREGAFSKCTALESVSSDPASKLQEIPNDAFMNCSSLTSISLPDSVTSIGAGAFASCWVLPEITLGRKVAYIGYHAFEWCERLEEVEHLGRDGTGLSTWDYLVAYIAEEDVLKEDIFAHTPWLDKLLPFSLEISGSVVTGFSGFCPEEIAIPDGVTEIADSAFDKEFHPSVYRLKSITFPESLRKIGKWAFYYCDGLEEVVLPDLVTSLEEGVFLSCTKLKKVKLPRTDNDYNDDNGIHEIPPSAFRYCLALEEIVIPRSVSSIGERAFKDCGNLKRIVFRSHDAPTVGENAFLNTNADCTGYIPYHAYYWFDELIDDKGNILPLPDNYYWEGIKIKYNEDCPPDGELGVQTIDGRLWVYEAFDGTADIMEAPTDISGNVVVPDTLGGCTVIGIDSWAFAYCTNMTSVTIPASVISINDNPFVFCSSLVSISVAADNSEYASRDGLLYNKRMTVLYACPAGLQNVTIPQGVVEINHEALKSCARLTSIALPQGVRILGESVFEDCTSLQSVVVPEGVVILENQVFGDCANLRLVSIPASVAKIECQVFADCSRLEKVVFNGNAPELFSEGTYEHQMTSLFDEYINPDCVVYVPRDSTGWGVSIPGVWQGRRIEYIDEDVIEEIEKVIEDADKGAEGKEHQQVTPSVPVVSPDVTAAWTAVKATTLDGAMYDADGDVAGIVQLKVSKPKVNRKTNEKTVKVSGYLLPIEGKKSTIKAVSATVPDSGAIEVSCSVRNLGEMTLRIGDDGFTGDVASFVVASADVGGVWTGGGATVSVGADDVSMFAGTVLTDLLPESEVAGAAGGKWKFSKAARVKWAKPKKGVELPEIYDETSGKGLIVDVANGRTNLSGMKLTYASKKGTFKGSFMVYALEGSGKGRKLKKHTFKVSGVVVDAEGHGMATCRKPAATWPVTVE